MRAEQAILFEEREDCFFREELAFDEVEQKGARRALVAPAWVGGSNFGRAD